MGIRNLFKVSLTCSTVTFRRHYLAEALEAIRLLGFGSADLGALTGLCEHVPPKGTATELRSVAQTVQRSGLAASSVNADPGSFNSDEPATVVLDRIERLLDFCVLASVPRLVLTCGEPNQSSPLGEQMRAVAEGVRAAAAAAEERSIELAVEAPHYLRPFCDVVKAGELMAMLPTSVKQVWDVSHVHASGGDANGFANALDRIGMIHLRDAAPGDIRRVLGAGEINFAKVLRTIAQVGFHGPVVLELETDRSPFDSKQEEVVDALRRLVDTGVAVSPCASAQRVQGRLA